MTEIRTITIVGAGQMGSGVAQAQIFDTTCCWSTSPRSGSTATVTFQESLTKPIVPRSGWPFFSDAAVTQISQHSHAEDADLLIEAATEEVDLKLKIFKQLGRRRPRGRHLGVEHQLHPHREARGRTSPPGAVVGMHFFNPVPVMPLVEVIRGMQTSTSRGLDRGGHAGMGKTPIAATGHTRASIWSPRSSCR